MWTPGALLLALAATSVLAWRPNNDYNYKVMTKTLTSLEGLNDTATGVFLRANFVIQPQTETVLRASLRQVQTAEVRQEAVNGHLSSKSEEQLPWKSIDTPAIEKPFEITLGKTAVKSLKVSKDVPKWALNIIRAVVSQIQVDVKGDNIIKSKMNSNPQEGDKNSVFKAMEDSVDGRCEVLYSINPLPKYIVAIEQNEAAQSTLDAAGDYIEVIKTTNFENCKERPVYNFGYPRGSSWEAGSNNMEAQFTRSQYQSVVIRGSLENNRLVSSSSVSKINLNPTITNAQTAAVYAQTNMTLQSMAATTQKLSLPENVQTIQSLVYTYNDLPTAAEKESSSSSSSSSSESNENTEFKQNIPPLEQAPNDPFLPLFIGKLDVSATLAKVEQLIKSIAKDLMESPTDVAERNTLAKFTILVDLLRTLPYSAFEKLTDDLYTQKQVTPRGYPKIQWGLWLALRDATAQAGTGPSLKIIAKWIRKQQIRDEEAAQIIATLAKAARLPTAAYMEELFSIVQSSQAAQTYRLNETSALVFAELLRVAHVDLKSSHNRYPVHAYGPFYNATQKAITEKYIPYFAQQLEQAVAERDSAKIQLYSRVIGKIAHPNIVAVLEPYLEGQKPMTTLQRTQVVVGMYNLAKTSPKVLRSILYKIYTNKGDAYQVRVAAVFGLFMTNLPVPMLQRMAHSVKNEASYQVRAVIQTGIESQAQLSEFNYELRKNARAAVHLLPRQSVSAQYSMQNFTDYVSSGEDSCFQQEIFTIGSQDSIVPNALFYNLRRKHNGAATPSLQAEYMVSSPSAFVDTVIELFKETVPSFAQAAPHQQAQAVKDILNKLQVKENVQQQLEGGIRVTFAGAERFMTFNNQTLERLAKIVKDKLNQYQYEDSYTHQKIYNEHELTLAVPLPTGLSFVFSYKAPAVMAVGGVVSLNRRDEEQKFTLSVNAHALYSTLTQSKLAILAPFNRKQYVAGHDRSIQVNIPVVGEVSGQLEKGVYQITASFKPTDIPRQRLIHLKSYPYTSVARIGETKPLVEEPETRQIHVRSAIGMERTGKQDIFGLGYDIVARTEKKPQDFMSILKTISQVGIQSYLASAQSDLGLESTTVDISNNPEATRTDTVKIVFAIKVEEDHYSKQEESKEIELNYGIPTSVPKELSSRAFLIESLHKVQSDLKASKSWAVNAGIELHARSASKPTKYAATIAVAKSTIDGKARLFIYARKESSQNSWQMAMDGGLRVPYTSVQSVERSLASQKPAELKAKLSFSADNDSETRMSFGGRLEQTEEYKTYIRQKYPEGQKLQGQELTSALHKARIYDQLALTVRVTDMSPSVSFAVAHAATYWGYEQSVENITGTVTSKPMKMQINLSPEMEIAKITIESPLENAIYRDVHVPAALVPLVAYSPMRQSLGQEGTAYFDQNQITTLSNLTYPAHLDNSWHVLLLTQPQLKYHQGKQTPRQIVDPVIVLGSQSNGPQIKMILVDGTTIELKPYQGKVQVQVNSKVVSQSYYYQANPSVQILITQQSEVQVVLDNIVLFHDGVRVQVRASELLRGKVLGLFGRHTGELNDLVTPQMKYVRRTEDLIQSYSIENQPESRVLGEEQVISYSQVVSDQDAGRYVAKRSQYDDSSSASSSSSSSSSESDERPQFKLSPFERRIPTGCHDKRIHVMEVADKLCFSVEVIELCKPQCQVVATQKQLTNFYCVEISATSRHWQKMAYKGSYPDFSQKSGIVRMQYELPTICQY